MDSKIFNMIKKTNINNALRSLSRLIAYDETFYTCPHMYVWYIHA